MDPLFQKQVRFSDATQDYNTTGIRQSTPGIVISQPVFGPARIVPQPMRQDQQGGSKVFNAIAELRNTYNNQINKLSASRLSEQTIPLNETVQTVTSFATNQNSCCAQSQQRSNCCNPCQQQPIQPVIVCGNSQQKKKKKKRISVLEDTTNFQMTPRRQEVRMQMRDPEIDNVKKEIHELERIIRNIETQPQQQQKEIEVHIQGEDKKCLKKLCKKIKSLEKELYEVARQRDESIIIKSQIDRENTEMFDRIGEFEALLKAADKKIFELSIMSERNSAYVRQLEDEVERLRRKKKRKQPTEIKEIIVEKFIDRPPQEIIKHVPVDRIIERPIEIIKEILIDRIVEKIVEVPRIEYIDRMIPQYIEKIIEIPVERIVEVSVPYERIINIPVDRVIYQDRIKEVPVERIVVREVPVDRIVDRIVEKVREVPVTIFQEVPVEVIVEVPYDRYIEVPYEKIVEVPTIQYIDRPVYIEIPVEKIIEYPVERRVDVPYERIVEVPYDRMVEVIVPVDRVVEVPVDRIIETRDEREIFRLQKDNQELLAELRSVRSRLEREIDIQRREGNEEVTYLKDQLRLQDGQMQDLSNESGEFRHRSNILEQSLNRERDIVSDLQQRLDSMYHEVERLASENNRKNDEMQQHITRLSVQLERRLQAPLRVAEYISQTQIQPIFTQSLDPRQLIQPAQISGVQQQLLSSRSRSPIYQQQSSLLPFPLQQQFQQQSVLQPISQQQQQQQLLQQQQQLQKQQLQSQQSQQSSQQQLQQQLSLQQQQRRGRF